MPLSETSVKRQLVLMAFETCVSLDDALHSPGGSTVYNIENDRVVGVDSEVVDRMNKPIRDFVFIHDALAQLALGNIKQTDLPPDLPLLWVAGARRTVDAYSLAAGSEDLATLPLLAPKNSDLQESLWHGVHHQLFAENPKYHGRRFGALYAVTVAARRLGFQSQQERPSGLSVIRAA